MRKSRLFARSGRSGKNVEGPTKTRYIPDALSIGFVGRKIGVGALGKLWVIRLVPYKTGEP